MTLWPSDSVTQVRTAPHLILLRGNSATGKTTLAARLQANLGPGTANIGQDHFRRVVLREHDVPNGDNLELIAHTIRCCTSLGYNVIAEGIFVAAHYRDALLEIINTHAGPTHVFYLDVPLEETLHRHGTRSLVADVTAAQLQQWYVPSDTLGAPGEIVLDGMLTLDATLQTIRGKIGAVPAKSPDQQARFI